MQKFKIRILYQKHDHFTHHPITPMDQNHIPQAGIQGMSMLNHPLQKVEKPWKDETFENIYVFFKSREPWVRILIVNNQHQQYSSAVDRSEYKQCAFRISQDIVKRCEQKYAQKRGDVIGLSQNSNCQNDYSERSNKL